MKKWLLAIFICALFALIGCEKKELISSDVSLSRVLVAKKLVMGVDADSPPLCFVYQTQQYTQYVGYDIDLARAVCRRLGVQLEIKSVDWRMRDKALKSGEVDCLWGAMAVSESRKEKYLLSHPYLRTAQVLVVRKDGKFNHIKDLHNIVIAIKNDEAPARALANNSEFLSQVRKVIKLSSKDDLFTVLQKGGADAIVVDLITAHDAIKRRGFLVKILEMPLSAEVYAVAFRKDDKVLASAVQDALDRIESSGDAYDLCKKWFGLNLSIIGVR